MKKLLLFIAVVGFLVSCDNYVPLYITTVDYSQCADCEGKRELTTERFEKDYLEISIGLYDDEYKTSLDIKKGGFDAKDNYTAKYIMITDVVGNQLSYSSTTDFLNYMSEAGYNMVTEQQGLKRSTKYTFKKKD